jgi:hypothetical protein
MGEKHSTNFYLDLVLTLNNSNFKPSTTSGKGLK